MCVGPECGLLLPPPPPLYRCTQQGKVDDGAAAQAGEGGDSAADVGDSSGGIAYSSGLGAPLPLPLPASFIRNCWPVLGCRTAGQNPGIVWLVHGLTHCAAICRVVAAVAAHSFDTVYSPQNDSGNPGGKGVSHRGKPYVRTHAGRWRGRRHHDVAAEPGRPITRRGGGALAGRQRRAADGARGGCWIHTPSPYPLSLTPKPFILSSPPCTPLSSCR